MLAVARLLRQHQQLVVVNPHPALHLRREHDVTVTSLGRRHRAVRQREMEGLAENASEPVAVSCFTVGLFVYQQTSADSISLQTSGV